MLQKIDISCWMYGGPHWLLSNNMSVELVWGMSLYDMIIMNSVNIRNTSYLEYYCMVIMTDSLMMSWIWVKFIRGNATWLVLHGTKPLTETKLTAMEH